jgi:cell wall assembly regulator SMI1
MGALGAGAVCEGFAGDAGEAAGDLAAADAGEQANVFDVDAGVAARCSPCPAGSGREGARRAVSADSRAPQFSGHHYVGMGRDIDSLWDGIVAWLANNAASTATKLLPPTSGETHGAVATAMGTSLPTDLLRWWQLTDGVQEYELDALIPPLFTPLPCATVLLRRQEWLETEERFALKDVDRETWNIAGEPSYRIHPRWLPIAEDGCGQTMFVDLRAGPRHGCIGVWDHESAWDDGIYWDDITDMLTDVHNALLHRHPALLVHASRRLRLFAGRDVDAAIFYAEVDADGELHWTEQQLQVRSQAA